MSKQLLIVNTDEIATTYAEIRAGKLGFIEEGAIAAVLSGAEAQLAVGDITTTPFKGSEVVRAVKQEPSAGTPAVATVDLSGADADSELYIKLINTTIGTMDVDIKSYEAADAAAIKDLIVADAAKFGSPFYGFSASVNANTVTITAPVNSTFRVAATDGAVISYTQTPVQSVGQEVDMKKLEEYCLPWMGVTNKVGFPVIKPDSKVEAGATYVQYVFDIARDVPNKAGTGTAAKEDIQIILAVKSDLATTIAILDGDAVVEEE